MAITRVANASASADNATSFSINVPTGTLDNDVMLLFVSCDGTTGASVPSGWTQIYDVNTSGTHNNLLCYRVASSEPASYTISQPSERSYGVIASYRGVDTTSPIDGNTSNTGGSDTTGVLSSITPNVNNCVVSVFVGTESGNAGNAIATSWPTTLVEQNDNVNGPPGTGNASSAGAYADVIQTTATAVSGNISLTGGNTNWGVMCVSLAPSVTNYVQNSFRIRDDDDDEANASWLAAVNTDWTPAIDTNFRVRFLVTDGNSSADTTSFQLEYRLDGGTWTDVNGSSSYIRSTASSNLTDGGDTTQQLGSGTFTTNNDGIDEANGLAGGQSVGADDETELEFCLQLRSAELSCPYTLELRLVESDNTELTYTNSPSFGGAYVDHPTPFDDLTTTNWRRALIGGATGTTKIQGGVDINEYAAEFVAAAASPSTTDQGYSFEFNATPSAVDMTDEIFIVSHAFNAPNRIQCRTSANRGNIFGLHTSDANYKEWSIGGNDDFIAYKPNHKCFIIDPTATATTTGGTSLDITSILYWKKVSRRENLQGSSSLWCYMSRAIRCSTLNSGNIPRIYGPCASFDTLVDTIHGTGYDTIEHNYVYQVGVAIFVGCPFSIGKSGFQTKFRDNGATIVSPESNSSNDPRFHLSPTAMRVYFDSMQSNDTATLSGTYIWGTRAAWNMNTVETISLLAANFTGMGNITCGAGVSGIGVFDDTGSVDLASASADLDGSSFLNSFATPIAAAIADDGGSFTDETTAAKECDGTDDVTLFPATPVAGTDRYYFGKGVHFTQIEIDVSTAGAGTYTVAYEYYDGASWSALTVTDNTNHFKNSGVNTVTFSVPNDWLPTTVNSQGPYFYVRAEIQSGTVTTVPRAQTIDLDIAGALVLPSAMTISTMTFTSCNRAIEIEAAGTYTLSNCIFSGNTIDVRNTSGGAVTLNLTNGTTSLSAADVESTGSGSITINNSVNLTVTVKDSAGNTVDGVFVSIHQTSDDTQLMNETTAVGVATTTFNYSSDTAIYIRVRQSSSQASFGTTSGVNGTTEVITTDAAHNFEDGEAVVYTKDGGSASIGLTDSTTYYVNDITSTTLSLHTSAADAISDTSRVNLTASGSETHLLTPTRYLQFSGTGTITSSGFSLEVTLAQDSTAA